MRKIHSLSSGNQHSTMSDEKVPCGLINQGMTCYLNAVLQALFMTTKFRDHVLSSSREENLLKALADLFRNLMHPHTAVSTKGVTRALNISNVHEQQDAAEYLQMILHRVPEPSEIFRGIIETSTMCSNCEEKNPAETDFLSIPLSIDKGQCDVKDALKEYLEIHDMSGDDQLYCVTCNSLKDMKTRNEIKKWPDILTLQLKRFEMAHTWTRFTYHKNECKIKIPSDIQYDSAQSSPVYDLYGIINHHGSYRSGHYDAFIKDKRGNWYHFNDHTVTKCSDHQWITDSSSSAYLLMYSKRYCGLENQGSSSCLNAVLQTLFMTKDFREHVKRVSSDDNFIRELKKLFKELETQEKTAVSAAGVTRSLGITDVHKQQDAAELLRLILKKTPGFSEHFKHTMKTTRTCRSCKREQEQISEDFLLFPSIQNYQDVEDVLQAYACGNKTVGSVYCDHCRKMIDIESKTEMNEFPEHLIVELKRSDSYSTNRLSFSKNEVIIRPHIKVSSHKYELYVVVNYDCGRYNADIKCEDEIWRRFNDSNEFESSLNSDFRKDSKLRSSDACLLVYRRREQTAGDTGEDQSLRSHDFPLTEQTSSSSLRKKSDQQSQFQTEAQHQGLEAQKERLITQVLEAVHGVTHDEAAVALKENHWNFTIAVQQLKIDQLYGMTQYSREECKQTLISFNWDLQKIFSVLTRPDSQRTVLQR